MSGAGDSTGLNEAAPGYSELCSFLRLIFAVVPGVLVVVSWCCEGPQNSLLYVNG